jgi:hypothetical protein
MDITYIPMARGFVHLAAVVDWFSRRVLSHRVSITMEAAFRIKALAEALEKHGRPELFNTDQGSQFTSAAGADVLLKAGVAISMDGKGSWRDMSSSSGPGDPSNTRKPISKLTTRWRKPTPRSATIFASIISADPMRALTG